MKRVFQWLLTVVVFFSSCAGVPATLNLKLENYFPALFFSWLLAGATPAAFLWIPLMDNDDADGRSRAPLVLALVCIVVTFVAVVYTLYAGKR